MEINESLRQNQQITAFTVKDYFLFYEIILLNSNFSLTRIMRKLIISGEISDIVIVMFPLLYLVQTLLQLKETRCICSERKDMSFYLHFVLGIGHPINGQFYVIDIYKDLQYRIETRQNPKCLPNVKNTTQETKFLTTPTLKYTEMCAF